MLNIKLLSNSDMIKSIIVPDYCEISFIPLLIYNLYIVYSIYNYLITQSTFSHEQRYQEHL